MDACAGLQFDSALRKVVVVTHPRSAQTSLVVKSDVTNEAKRFLKIKDHVFPAVFKAKRCLKIKELLL